MYWSHGHIQTNTSLQSSQILDKRGKIPEELITWGQRCRILVKALALHEAILGWISGIQEVPGGH